MDFDAFKNDCQAFIFNWHRVSENAKLLQTQFTDLGVETYVINSDESENDNGLPNWINIGESSYMVQQYAKGIECFNKTYFLEMLADIYDVEAELILERAWYTFNKYDCGVYTPNVYYNYWDFDRSKIPKLEENLYEVLNPESLLTFIHKDVLKGLHLDTENYTFGWGIDLLVCVLAHMENKLVIRDYITTIRHEKGMGYNGQEAQAEQQRFIDAQGEEITTLMRKFKADAYPLLNPRPKRILFKRAKITVRSFLGINK